jgi:hypothetical protein
MSDPRLPELLAMLPPDAGLDDARWRAVEQSLGLALPRTYKALVDRFGASSWGDFLHVLSPFDERLNLHHRGKQALDADKESRKKFPWHYPLPLYPEAGGLLPWALTDNGDTLYFITSASPDQWPTVIKGPRAPEFEVSFLPPALLIHQVAARRFQSVILPDL